MQTKLKILHLEEITADTELVERALKNVNIQFEKLVVDNKIAFVKALKVFNPDIILSEYKLPCFNASDALKIISQQGEKIPFILITSILCEENAIEIIKAGADDYFFKDRMFRLPYAILNAVEKNNAAQQLRKSEVLNKCILSSVNSHIAVIDESGEILTVNKAWNDFGNKNSNLTLDGIPRGSNYFDACKKGIEDGDSDAEKALAGIQSIFKKNRLNFEMEYSCHSPQNQQWFMLSAVNLGSNTNQVVISHHDINYRKIAEKNLEDTSTELRKTLSELNNILDFSLDVICTVNTNGEFVNVSAASEKIWGYKPSELIGTKFINLVLEEDVEITSKAAETIYKKIKDPTFENRYVHKSGKIIPMLWSVNWDEKQGLLYCIAKDITEKKNLEKAVKNERDQFYDMFLKAPSAVGMLKGPDHVFEMANPLYLHLIGEKNIIGKSVAEALPEVIEQGFISQLDRVYQTGESYSGTETLVKLKTQDNAPLTELYINYVYQAYRNNKGKIVGVFFFINDVTEQVVSKKKVEKSEKQYRQIVETAEEGIWLLDENSKTTFVNKKIGEMLGYSEEEMMGKTSSYFLDADGQEYAQIYLDRRKMGIAEKMELSFISKKGNRITTQVSANPIFDELGNFKGSLGMLFDITEKKHLENLLDKSNRLARIGSWEIDVIKGTVYWSDITKEIREAAPDFIPDLSIGIGHFNGEVNKKIITERLKQCIENGIPWDEELEITTFKGNLKWVRTIGEAEFVEGKCAKIYGSFQDITERKKGDSERVKMISDVVQRNSDLEQFSYIISHNLRAPTANIMGFADILQHETLTQQERKESLQGLSASVTSLDAVIKDINNILQVKNESDDKKEVIDFSRIVKDIKLSLNNLIEKHSVSISTDFTEVNEIHSLKIFVYSIFYNLIDNSIKYGKPNVPTQIEIKSKQENNKIIITFKDNGLGLDMKFKKNKIFGLYNRFHSHVEGKGMGLFIVKTQVESLGGKITLLSELNKGTEFTIVFKN